MRLADVGVRPKHAQALLKHQLPGNALLAEKEDAKLGSRQNRYGVFQEGAASEFDRVVEITRDKMVPKQLAQKTSYSSADQAKGKAHLGAEVKRLAERAGSKLSQNMDISAASHDDDENYEEVQEDSGGVGDADALPTK